ncbi:hypothetical protein [Thauera sp. WH-1]|uniref:hypothetical protein n=1 Tax=Thauera sp. WH-1 TaxID=3398230 RepID=UPI0039FBF30F
MEEKELVDWVISKDARETLLIASIIGSVVFLLYGVFNGKPPFLKEAQLDEKGRRISLWLGGGFVGIFLLTLTIPMGYDFAYSDRLALYIGDRLVSERNVSFLALDENANRLEGAVTVKRIGREGSKPIFSLPIADHSLSVHTSPLKFVGSRGGKEIEIAKGGGDRIWVSDDAGKVLGPIKIRDAQGREIGNIPTNNWGAIIIPDNARVEFYNAALLYRDQQGSIQRKWIGSRLDFNNFEYGGYEELLREWQEPRAIQVLMISDGFQGRPMSSSISYDPTTLVAASNFFPIGTELLIGNPLVQSTPISVTVQDSTRLGRLVLSSAAFEALQFEHSGNPVADVQIVDYHFKRAKNVLSQTPVIGSGSSSRVR